MKTQDRRAKPGVSRAQRPARHEVHGAAQVVPVAARAALASRCACGGGCPRCQLGDGRLLPGPVATRLGAALGADLSGVRLHTGPQAAAAVAAVGARSAFAQGEHIVVGTPGFTATRSADLSLLAHEATHVVQQRPGLGARRPTGLSLEGQARASADAVATGRRLTAVRAGVAPAGAVQRDEPATPTTTPTAPPAASGDYTLQLDPTLQARLYFAQWLAQQSAGGAKDDADTGATVPQPWLKPPEVGGDQPDFSKLITPYYQRGIIPGGSGDTRDLDVIRQLYAERYQLTLGLPDLRALAAAPIRSLIPLNWRASLAETLTSTTIDNALKRDHPTFIELSNQTFDRETGATTVLLPKINVPYVNDWWNKFSGGGK